MVERKRWYRGALWLVACGGALAGCSSSDPSTGGSAATLMIAGGDGQSGAPATALPVALSVLVHDGSGAPVGGVAVSFTVDSGGGAIASPTAISGSDGVAVAGSWTLGAIAGSNVITARASGYTSVKFHAQAFGSSARPVITGATVPSGGGTIAYQKPGDPLDGLAITVPASAYTAPTQWTVVADSSVPVPLPADFSQVGPALVISNGQGFADSTMTLTMPLTVDPSMAVAPFYFDPATGTLEGIPIVARTATTVTLAAKHFSGDFMAIPGRQAGAGARASLNAGFGNVRVVWVQIPQSKLAGTYSTGFSAGVDNWEFINYGDYIAPDGDCEGMSISELYYYYFVRRGGAPGLYHHFDVSLANPYDNVQGIRFAASVQGDYLARWAAGINQIAALQQLGAQNGTPPQLLTPAWIALTIKLTHQPVLVGLQAPTVGHAVVAYGVSTTGSITTVSFADPNFPTELRTMTFRAGVLDPLPMSVNADATPENFSTAYALGVTAEVPLTAIVSRWIEFLDKDAGADRYPQNYTLEVFDSLANVWSELGDTVRTTISPLKLRLRCSDCPIAQGGGVDPANLQIVHVFNDSGTTAVGGDGSPTPVTLTPGAASYVAVAEALSPHSSPPGKQGYVDSRTFAVIFSGISLLPAVINDKVDSTYTFAASSGGVATPRSRFVWQFGDGTDSVVVVGDTTATHKFARVGTFKPVVTMYDSVGLIVGRATSQVTVAVTVIRGVWQLQTAGVQSPLNRTLDSFPDKDVQQNVNRALNSMSGNPSTTLIFAVDSADCKAIVAEQFQGATVDAALLPGVPKIMLAGSCKSTPNAFLGNIVLGAIGSGVMTGSVGEGAFGFAGWSSAEIPSYAATINATMTGLQLSGAFDWTVDYTEGAIKYEVTFTAVQVTPAGLRLSRAVRR